MDIFNIVNFLYHEQEGIKQKYVTLIRLVSEVIEQLKNANWFAQTANAELALGLPIWV